MEKRCQTAVSVMKGRVSVKSTLLLGSLEDRVWLSAGLSRRSSRRLQIQKVLERLRVSLFIGFGLVLRGSWAARGVNIQLEHAFCFRRSSTSLS